MLADGLPFGIVELAGLVEDGVGDGELAEVVQEGGTVDELAAGSGEAKVPGEGVGGLGDAEGVAIGEGAFGVDNVGEGFADAIGLLRVDEADLTGLHVHDADTLVGAIAAGPQAALAVEGDGEAGEIGVEPGCAAVREGDEGTIAILLEGEDVKVLGDGENAGEEGDLIAAEAVGVATTVPMLVEGVNGVGAGLAEADFANDVGPSLAAKANHFSVVAIALKAQAGDAEGFSPCGGAGEGIFPAEPEGGERDAGPVDGFDFALGGAVVRTEDLAHAGCVGGAADVFQEEGVIEVDEGGVWKLEGAADAHADHTTAEGVAGNGVFGEVKGERERGDDLREGDACGGIVVGMRIAQGSLLRRDGSSGWMRSLCLYGIRMETVNGLLGLWSNRI